MSAFPVYEQAIEAARQLRRLRKAYEGRASCLTFLTEWMSGLCRSINIDEECIQKRWGGAWTASPENWQEEARAWES